MLPLIMAAISALGKNKQAQDAAKQKNVDILQGGAREGAPGTGNGVPEQAGGIFSLLGGLGGAQKHAKADPTSITQQDGSQADPLSYDSVKSLDATGLNGKDSLTNEDLLSDY